VKHKFFKIPTHGGDAKGLQAGYAAALAITAHADVRGFLREQLRRAPSRISC
jgi:hypothetical protein